MAGTSAAVQGSASAMAEEDDMVPWNTIAQMNSCMDNQEKVSKLIQILGADNITVHGVSQFMDHCFTKTLFPFMLMPE